MIKDVEKQQAVDDALRLLTEAINATSDSVFLIRADFPSFIYVNQTASTKLEYSVAELMGMSVFDIDPDLLTIELWQRNVCDLKVLRSRQFETRHKTKSGYCYPVEMTVTFSQHYGQDVILAIVRDVTERKSCEASVIEREQQLRALAESSPGVMGSFVMREGRLEVSYVSQNVLDIFGLFPHDVINNTQSLQALMDPKDVKKLYLSLQKSAQNLNEWFAEFRIEHPTKGLRWLEGRAKPQPYAKGGIIWHGHVYDITDRKTTEDSLRLSLDFNAGIIAAIPDLLFEIERDGTYVGVWSKNKELLLMQREELVGKKFQDILPPNAVEAAYKTMAEADKQGYSIGNKYSLDLPDGKHWFELYVTKKTTSDTYITLARDITEKKASERMLTTLVEALNISSESIFLIELDTGRFIYANDTACRLLGYNRKELTSGMGVVDIDPNMTMEHWHAHVQDIRKIGHTSINSHHQSKQGCIYPIEALSHYFEYEGDEFSLAVTRDISEQLQAQQEMAKISNFMKSVLNALPDLLFEVDGEGTYLNIWASDSTLLAKQQELLLGKQILDVLGASNNDLIMKAIQEAEQKGRSVGQRIFMDVPAGRKWFELSVSKHLPYENRFLILSRDVTELKTAKNKMQHLAYHDPLIGLPNRLMAKITADKMIEEAKSSQTSMALLYMDLDDFKTINDAFGHNVGDAVIKEISAQIQQCMTHGSTLCRQGDDEFLVLVPEVTLRQDMDKLAQNILNIFEHAFEVDHWVLTSGASIGITLYPEHGDDFETLLKHAELAMYYSKRKGKQNYHFFMQGMTRYSE